MEHGAKAAAKFTTLIKETLPKGDKPGRNRSLVIGKVGLKPVILVSSKKPTRALAELGTMSAKLGRVTPLVHGQVVFEHNVIHLKALKAANEGVVKKAFLDYYAAYHLAPPSLQIKLWQPQDWEAAEFEEDPDDDGAVDEDETESGAVETGAVAAEDNRARMTEAAEQFKKFQAIVGATPAAQPFLQNAEDKLREGYARFKAADYTGMEAALESAKQLLLAAGKAHQEQSGKAHLGVEPQAPTARESAQKADVQDKAPDQSPARVKARDAYRDADWESVVEIYLNPATSKEDKAEVRQMMTKKTGAETARAKDEHLALIFEEPSRKRDDAIGDALLALAGTSAKSQEPNLIKRDPKRFEQLARCISLDVWNDSGKGIGASKRGLGPRVCAALWLKGGGYDEICKLIELGVDTTIPAPSETKGGLGVYSDYVQPLQHLLQEHLRDTSKLGTDAERAWTGEHKSQVEGAAKIFKALKASGANVTVTEWSEVTGSEMIKEFKNNPGTIWGFEDVRLPFVQASHETPQGAQPVRMMELWDAVMPALDPPSYEKLRENPKEEIKRIVEAARKQVESEFDSKSKYAEVRERKAEYLKKFEADAAKFLAEFAGQIPKVTFAMPSPDMKGVQRPRVVGRPDPFAITIADVSGIHHDKFKTSFACKAGLWWAKNEGKPVYYCLDGIDMKDVVDYKRTKNKAIEAFLSEGGPALATKPHREVVTLKEMREILRNWDELKDTVRFSLKGRILKGDELKKLVGDAQSAMEQSNKEAGRTPAPPRANFRVALAQIDPSIMGDLDRAVATSACSEKEADMNARDIVRKAGYLLKIAKARPEYVLKYLMSKCEVLAAYLLIPPGLPQAAAKFAKLASLEPPAEKKTLNDAGAELIEVLKKCPPYFRQPLSEALVRHPMVERDKKLKKALKAG